MKQIPTAKNTLRSFGITMGIAFLVITFFIALKPKHSLTATSLISAFFFLAGIFAPPILKPVHFFWMGLARILGWINTRLLLCAVFYGIFFPMGLIMRLCGRDLLDRKFEKDKTSYWQKRKTRESCRQNYEKQF